MNAEDLIQAAKQGETACLGQLLQLYRNYLRLLTESQLDRKLRRGSALPTSCRRPSLQPTATITNSWAEPNASFLAWLRQILVNHVFHQVERHVLAGKRDIRREVSLEQVREGVERSGICLRAILADPGMSPSSVAQQEESLVRLADRLTQLAPHHREVLMLRHFQGLPFESVAREMGRSPGSTRVLWLRAIRRLRELFDREASDVNQGSVADRSLGDSLTSGQEQRLAAILDAYLVSLEQGLAPSVDEVLARHPDLAGTLRSYLEDVHRLQAAVANFAHGCVPIDAPDPGGPPRRLGDFELIREIGRGGMGIVFEAWQVSLQRRVALKVLPLAAMLDSKRLIRFQNEAHASAQLDHPHIVPVHAIGAEHGVHYFAMQYIDGQPLNEVIRHLRLCSKQPDLAPPPGTSSLQAEFAGNRGAYYRSIARLGVEAAQALHAAHEVGIVHRDIKPSNLLLDAQGKLWVTDFGLARCQANADLTPPETCWAPCVT